MSTGIGSWANPSEITAIYPFVGTEVLLVIAGFAFWIWWQVRQIRDENAEMEKQAAYYRKIGLERAMHSGGAATIATEEEVKTQPASVTVTPEKPTTAAAPGVEPTGTA